MPIFTVIGLTTTTLACLCFYAASPNQKMWSKAWPSWPAYIAGTALLVAAWLAFAQDMRPLATAFALVTTLMLALSVLPYIGALVDRTPP
ncbi:hypothetical protein [Ottowia thiooxydans]|uniref:hypothetical protein n=1 Tax=Ottowia thiooxydans TaxID=219182 RepID=UPI000424A958|nr:hypothetical protein [Ottowia thiooxydans]